jgi:hypothetical protein
MDEFSPNIVPALAAIGAIIFVVLLVGIQVARSLKRRDLLRHGEIAVARVVSISQTGTSINEVPEMRLVLEMERAGEHPHRIKITELIDLGSMPRVGERVYVFLAPKDPDRGTLAPAPSGTGAKVSIVPAEGGVASEFDLGSNAVRDVVALSPRLREHGKLGIAGVISISRTDTTAYQIVLDIEAIGAQPRRVATTQTIDGKLPSPRERVYVLVDPDNPDVVALLPESLGGQTLPADSNRLEPGVLGPEILHKGATAKGVVVSATELPRENRALAAKGCSTWELTVYVKPDDDSPVYRAPLPISFTTPENAKQATRPGAELFLRYDPADPRTFSIDSFAMGRGDPYERLHKMLSES